MKKSGNTILITGGASGIGRALAERFHDLDNHVLIAGRGEDALEKVAADREDMRTYQVDMSDASSIDALAAKVTADFPALDAVFHVAGIMKPEDLKNQPDGLPDANATIATNLLGPIRLTAALLPAFLKQPHATILTVSSGLAFVPMAMTPTYSATKAAIHSYTESLRFQLRESSIDVVELIPPYVATTLMGDHQSKDPNAMPLDEFITETMSLLLQVPTPQEINVKRVYPMRFAAEQGREKFEAFFTKMNEEIMKQAAASAAK